MFSSVKVDKHQAEYKAVQLEPEFTVLGLQILRAQGLRKFSHVWLVHMWGPSQITTFFGKQLLVGCILATCGTLASLYVGI